MWNDDFWATGYWVDGYWTDYAVSIIGKVSCSISSLTASIGITSKNATINITGE